MTVRSGRPERVAMPDVPLWRIDADSAVHHLARDFAHVAVWQSRKLRQRSDELEGVIRRIAAGAHPGEAYLDVEAIVTLLVDEAVGIAAEIGVEVDQRFRPDDVWRAMVTEYGQWAQDWAEPDDRP